MRTAIERRRAQRALKMPIRCSHATMTRACAAQRSATICTLRRFSYAKNDMMRYFMRDAQHETVPIDPE